MKLLDAFPVIRKRAAMVQVRPRPNCDYTRQSRLFTNCHILRQPSKGQPQTSVRPDQSRDYIFLIMSTPASCREEFRPDRTLKPKEATTTWRSSISFSRQPQRSLVSDVTDIQELYANVMEDGNTIYLFNEERSKSKLGILLKISILFFVPSQPNVTLDSFCSLHLKCHRPKFITHTRNNRLNDDSILTMSCCQERSKNNSLKLRELLQEMSPFICTKSRLLCLEMLKADCVWEIVFKNKPSGNR